MWLMKMVTSKLSVSAARMNLKTTEVDANDVTHIDAARNQIIGSSAGLIPFIEKNYVYRSLMGANQQRQAVPLINPEAPIVGTGVEAPIARNTGQIVLAEADGEVTKTTADEVVVRYKEGQITYHPQHFVRVTRARALIRKWSLILAIKLKKATS